MDGLFQEICKSLNSFPRIPTTVWEHEDFRHLSHVQQKSILERLSDVIHKDPDQRRGGALYTATELIIDRILRTIEPGEKSLATEEVIMELSRIYQFCKKRVIRDDAPVEKDWTVTSMALWRIFSYMQDYEKSYPILHNLVGNDYHESVQWAIRHSEHTVRDAVIVVSPQWLIKNREECQKVFQLLYKAVKDHAASVKTSGIYKVIQTILNPLLSTLAHPVDGLKESAGMITKLNSVCESCLRGRKVSSGTLVGLILEVITQVCIEDYELPCSVFYGDKFLDVMERALGGKHPHEKTVYLCCRNTDWSKVTPKDVSRLFELLTAYVYNKPEDTQKAHKWRFGIMLQCARGVFQNLFTNPKLEKDFQRGSIQELARFCCTKSWKVEPYVTGRPQLLCDLEEDYITTTGGVLFVLLEEYLLENKENDQAVLSLKHVLLTIWEHAEGEALAYATEIVQHVATVAMNKKSAQELIGKYVSGENPEIIVNLAGYYKKCTQKEQTQFHLQVMNLIKKMPAKHQTCFYTMDLLIHIANTNIKVFNGDHVQVVASLLAEGMQSQKILRWLGLIAEKRPEEVKHATRVIIHTTDFDDANVPLVASILANVSHVDQAQASQSLDLLMTDMQYHDSDTKAAVLSSVQEIGRTIPKNLVRYKDDFEDLKSSPTTTAQCDEILQTIQVTQDVRKLLDGDEKKKPSVQKPQKEEAIPPKPVPVVAVSPDTPQQKEQQIVQAKPDQKLPMDTINETDENSPDVFLSYQWGKQEQIKALYAKFQSIGISCWMDIQMMGGGDALYASIDSGMRSCKVVIACVTNKYSMSANCRREVSLADSIKKPIIPLLLERIPWPPPGPMAMIFAELVYINFCKPSEEVQRTWNCPQWDELEPRITRYLKTSKAKTKPKSEPNNQSENRGAKRRSSRVDKTTARRSSTVSTTGSTTCEIL